ncbi:exonuclease SbcCD subunit D [Abyssisolibacter fermentans]|uniref:exonuclease SbcCD subunit D n=1 Tax=Abyssisolibacter fermentans TaxID=1766203 RepID=UPI000830FF47|nr:exonuclease SbcCD subunit D [Abyssisolibacter fermentans]
MKILHTSDWHLGKYLEGYSRLDEQEKILKSLINLIKEKQIDVVLIAGDIYDNSNPPARAEKIFYDTVKEISEEGKRIVIAIAGNHDSPERLSASKALAYDHGIILMGTLEDIPSTGKLGNHEIIDSGRGYIEVKVNEEKAVFGLLPYPSEQRLKEVFKDVNDTESMQVSYSHRVGQIFAKINDKYRDDTINIAASHIFVEGGETSDSERPIQIGGGLVVEADKLPSKAQYIALGHLHRPQRVKKSEKEAYYSGSLIQYSSSEIGYSKGLYMIDIVNGQKPVMEEIFLENIKPIEIWKCNGFEEAIKLCNDNSNRDVWVYLKIRLKQVLMQSEIKKLKEIKPDLLSIIPIFDEVEETQHEQIDFNEKNISKLFEEFYIHERGVKPGEELLNLFNSIVYEAGDINEA